MRSPFAGLCIALSLLTACVTDPDEEDWLWDLDGTRWRLVSLDGNSPLAGTEITLEYDRERMQGSAGVNRYFTSWAGTHDAMAVGVVATTRLVRDEPAGAMAQESRFVELLRQARAAEREGGELVFTTPDGGELRFEALP